MIQRSLFIGMSRSAASAARIAMSTSGRTLGGVLAGALVSFAAHAANCSAPPVSGKVYNIVNEGSGLYLDVVGGRTDNGADVIQWAPTRGANQQWTLTKVGNDAWTLQAVHSKKSLDLANWRTDAGATFKQWASSQNTNQLFFLRSQGSGAVNIVSRLSWQLVTADASNAKPGVYQDYDKSAASQRWYLNPADGNCSTGSTGKWGSFMGFDRILLGGLMDESTPDHWTPDTMNRAPWDLHYQYIHSPTAPFQRCYSKCDSDCKHPNGGIDGDWWGCYKMSNDGMWNLTPGQKIIDSLNKNATGWKPIDGKPHRVIEQFSWYAMEDLGRMQMRINQKNGSLSGDNDYKGALQNWGLLKSYLDDYRFLLRRIGTEKSMLHLEPDSLGFLRNLTGDNPHAAYAPVRFAGGDDCKQEEESFAGLISCMFKMTDQYAPNATVGLHFTCWNWKDPEKAKSCVTYYQNLGAGQGDFLVMDVNDRDAAYAEIVEKKGKGYWWSDQDFAQFLNLIKQVTEGVGKPMVLWQIPIGNDQQWNAPDHWRDEKVKLLFDNIDKLAEAHVVALQFGAGWGHQTSTETDGGYLLKRGQDYYNRGGVRLK